MKKTLIAAGIMGALFSGAAQAEYQYGFANAYIDHLNWHTGFESVDRKSHTTLGAEGGAGFTWGEIYGFYEYEKIFWASSERSQALKGSIHFKLYEDFTLYAQVYDINDNKWSDEQNRVIGFGYVGLTGNNWWFKPFIGYHDLSSSDNRVKDNDGEGGNGGMFGWNAGYRFQLGGHNMMVTNWHEMEFSRNDAYANIQYGKTGQNGALGIWYDITDKLYVGFQYRYFQNKLGYDGYGDALIYRIGYHF